MTTTAEATLQMHPHAFAVIVFERPADARFTVDMVAANDVSDDMIAAMIRGIASQFTFDGESLRDRIKTAIQTAQDQEGRLLYVIPPGVAGIYADAVMRVVTGQHYPEVQEHDHADD